jgi:cytochrome c oxidase subunit 4
LNSPASPRIYAYTWAALIALLAATFTLAHFDLGAMNPVASLAIATVKAVLVALVFMNLRRSSALVALFALVAFLALGVLFTLSGADYATRDIHAAPWAAPDGH